MEQPLAITADDELADEISRLAAVAGSELIRLTGPGQAGDAWRNAPLVLLDEQTSQSRSVLELPRRDGLVLIGTKPPPEFWRTAFEWGADLALELPDDQARLVELFADARDVYAAHPGAVLAVLGGCGGAGASALATATSLAAARQGQQCMLLDCDPLGGGLDLAVGAENVQGLRWSDMAISGGRVAARALDEALPSCEVGTGRLTLLSCDRAPSREQQEEAATAPAGLTPQSLQAVIDSGRRAGQTVVCDLPRSLNAATLACIRAADLVIVVVPAEVRACAAAARLIRELPESGSPVKAVVRGPAPGGLKASEIGSACGLEVLTAMRAQTGLAAAMDKAGLAGVRSAARGPLGTAARAVLTELARHGRQPAQALAGAA